MPTPPLDFRSDTVTRPTAAMMEFMASAPLGDDVFDEDPTIHALQDLTAEMLGKEAAIFVPSGTMSNQIGVRIHCNPGEEFLCEAECHIFYYEQGAYAQLSGLVANPIQGRCGVLEPGQFEGKIRPDDQHFSRTRLVCLENTHNRGAGRIQPYEYVEEICRWAHENSLATHMDGARLMNAAVASGIPASDWAQHFDTVSICFSKGLGAPVGSALVGTKNAIAEARRHRKAFGGGMRQAGVIAAGALFALQNHVDRLAEDHAHAAQLAEVVRETEGLTLFGDQVQTNIVAFDVEPALGSAPQFVGRLKEQGLLVLAVGPTRIRAVTHLDVDGNDVERACEILKSTVALAASGSADDLPVGKSYG